MRKHERLRQYGWANTLVNETNVNPSFAICVKNEMYFRFIHYKIYMYFCHISISSFKFNLNIYKYFESVPKTNQFWFQFCFLYVCCFDLLREIAVILNSQLNRLELVLREFFHRNLIVSLNEWMIIIIGIAFHIYTTSKNAIISRFPIEINNNNNC